MKYWWLKNYKNYKIIQIKQLQNDINYFLTMPKNYNKQYEILKEKDINDLKEEELLIVLKKIINSKNIEDNSLNLIINKLLEIPDNSFPTSDYTIDEIITEIKNLKTNLPTEDKLENNNLAICYNCLNIFYVDKINSVNKKNLCLCPFCLKSKLYFDNDYIPMNYTFIKLASIYYGTSSLGCTFKEIKKIIKKSIKVENSIKTEKSIDLTEFLSNKIKPVDEKIISKQIYDLLIKKEENFDYKVTLSIKEINKDVEHKLLILLVSIIEVLSNSIYIKEIMINTNEEISKEIIRILKIINK